MVSRRRFVRSSLCAIASFAVGSEVSAKRAPFWTAKTPIGLQMGVLGAEFEKAPVETLRQIRRIGYRSVEIGLAVRDPALVRLQLDDAGLQCTSGMLGMGALNLAEPGPLIDAARRLGVTDVVLSAMTPPGGFRPAPGMDMMAAYVDMTTRFSADDFKQTADMLNRQGELLAREGLRLGYHNHNFEFRRFGDRSGLDILLAGTDPARVSFEMDAGWVTAAGIDPVALLRAHPGRFTQMHVKEVAKANIPNTRLNIVAAPVGQGVVDWPVVLAAARAAGVRRFYVEQDPPFAVPRMQMVTDAYAYLAKLRPA